MPNYDFQALSSYDFELLVRDLLQKELKVRLESFGKGRDKGIDFRFRTVSEDIVVQCKHYASYDSLVSVLKRDEAQKVSRLKPTRYILAVSTPLTPHRKDEIMGLFAPYCVAPADIFGREDLNNLLGIHSDIETKHFKLWLTSEPVLQKILHAGIWGDSELTVERIRNRTSKYVAGGRALISKNAFGCRIPAVFRVRVLNLSGKTGRKPENREQTARFLILICYGRCVALAEPIESFRVEISQAALDA